MRRICDFCWVSSNKIQFILVCSSWFSKAVAFTSLCLIWLKKFKSSFIRIPLAFDRVINNRVVKSSKLNLRKSTQPNYFAEEESFSSNKSFVSLKSLSMPIAVSYSSWFVLKTEFKKDINNRFELKRKPLTRGYPWNKFSSRPWRHFLLVPPLQKSFMIRRTQMHVKVYEKLLCSREFMRRFSEEPMNLILSFFSVQLQCCNIISSNFGWGKKWGSW